MNLYDELLLRIIQKEIFPTENTNICRNHQSATFSTALCLFQQQIARMSPYMTDKFDSWSLNMIQIKLSWGADEISQSMSSSSVMCMCSCTFVGGKAWKKYKAAD